MEIIITLILVAYIDTVCKGYVITSITWLINGADEAIIKAAYYDNIIIIKRILKEGKCSDKVINTALHVAVENNKTRALELLLKSAGYSDKGMDNTLYTAVKKNSIGTLKLLLKLEYSDKGMDNAFSIAADNNNIEALELLLKSVKCSDNVLDAILYIASGNNKIGIITLLIESGKCSDNMVDDVLDRSVRKNELGMLKLLLGSGRCSEKIIKNLFFGEDGKLKDKYNNNEMKNLLKYNYLLSNDLFKEVMVDNDSKELNYKSVVQEEYRLQLHKEIHLFGQDMCLYYDESIMVAKNIIMGFTKIFYDYLNFINGPILKEAYEALIDAPKTKQKAVDADKEEKEVQQKENKKITAEEINGKLSESLGEIISVYDREDLKELLLEMMLRVISEMEVSKPKLEMELEKIDQGIIISTKAQENVMEEEMEFRTDKVIEIKVQYTPEKLVSGNDINSVEIPILCMEGSGEMGMPAISGEILI
ncbi:MAG: hypothetical protein ACI8ZF_000950 [Candidatus Midichloriaceae bacterium]|jgi:hypothetical protein